MNRELHLEGEQLAALFDGELKGDELQAAERHVAGCASCASKLEDMVLARYAVWQLSRPSFADVWPCVEAAIDREEHVATKASSRSWAAAAMVALVVGIVALFTWRGSLMEADKSRLPVVASAAPIDFGLYLASLEHAGEMPALPPGYEFDSTSVGEALGTIGITDGLNLDALPPDIRFRGAGLIKHGSSTVVQLTFEHNGEMLVVLRQPDGQPVSFGQFPVTTTIAGRRKCLTAYCGTYRALCLTTKKGTITVLGPTRNARLMSLFETVTST